MNQIKKVRAKKVREKVKFILEMFPQTRNNDNLLCSIYWREIDSVRDISDIQNATSAEAIRRSRQLINADKLLLATDPSVLKKRKQMAVEMRALLGRK